MKRSTSTNEKSVVLAKIPEHADIPDRSAQRIFAAADKILKAGVEPKDKAKEELWAKR